jgi:hypothetical protein
MRYPMHRECPLPVPEPQVDNFERFGVNRDRRSRKERSTVVGRHVSGCGRSYSCLRSGRFLARHLQVNRSAWPARTVPEVGLTGPGCSQFSLARPMFASMRVDHAQFRFHQRLVLSSGGGPLVFSRSALPALRELTFGQPAPLRDAVPEVNSRCWTWRPHWLELY